MLDENKIEAFKKLIQSKEQVYIFLHDFPDPDAIGAAAGLKKVIEKFDKPVSIFGQHVSHPQNKKLLNILQMELLDPFEYQFTTTEDTGITGNAEEGAFIMLDFNIGSSNCKFTEEGFHADWTIDHHNVSEWKANGHSSTHLEAVGSTCTLIVDYMKAFDVLPDSESDEDCRIASAMMLGIITDTNNLREAVKKDLDAFGWLQKFYDQDILSRMESYDLKAYHFNLLNAVHTHKHVAGSLAVLPVGFIKESQRDAIPWIADLWIQNEDLSIVVVFALIQNTIAASVRVRNADSVKPADLAKQIFQSKDAGGRFNKAGATVKLNPFFDLELLGDEDRKTFIESIAAIIVARAKSAADKE